MTLRSALLLSLLFVFGWLPAQAAKPLPPPDAWVGTWGCSPMAQDNRDGRYGSADMTLRQIVHVSVGGPLVRIELSNEFGTEPLQIGAAHIALSSGANGDIQLMTANALTFGGRPSITIPPGAAAISDAAALALPGGGDLAVSLFLPAQTITHLSAHLHAAQTSFAVPGNVVGAGSLPSSGVTKILSWYFLKGVDVRLPGTVQEDGPGTIVALGDSITDGAAMTTGSNGRWTDVLARRLQRGKSTRGLGVVNEGIGGNRLLHDNTGPGALARFDRDVLARPGVKYLVVLEGINDIGHAADPNNPADPVTADDLIQALRELAERAHAHGIRVYGATLTPYMGATYESPAGEAMRQAYNGWIRSGIVLDGFIDFDKAAADSAHPDTFNPAFDSGDHLHPNDAGYRAMGESIGLKLFQPRKKDGGPNAE